ncbi:MAG: DUF1365 family protein, partial [Pseudomonadota bacterium]
KIIEGNDWLEAQKVFHVSPFLHRVGGYKFRFDYRPQAPKNRFSVWIDYYNEEEKKQLVTSLIGKFEPMTKRALAKAFWGYPLVTFKAITLIHWQAIKLIFKKIKYVPKPVQFENKITKTGERY